MLREDYHPITCVMPPVVAVERGEALFELVYFAAGLDAPHAGMVMMGQAFCAAGLEPVRVAGEDVQQPGANPSPPDVPTSRR